VVPGYVRRPLVGEQIADQALARGIPAAHVTEQVFLERTAIKRLIKLAEAALWLCTEHAG